MFPVAGNGSLVRKLFQIDLAPWLFPDALTDLLKHDARRRVELVQGDVAVAESVAEIAERLTQ
jgi:hypothetical protein